MYKNFQVFVESKYFFYATLVVNIILLFVTKFYPSMDGPAHLYNSNIVLNLLLHNNILSDYFILNPLLIPNWTSHIIMAIFQVFLPAWVAEKLLIIIYVIGMALSFRFLIKVINPKNIALSILIFPFIYSFLFHLGFYNFSLSFILFFLTIGFWIRKRNEERFINYFILFILITIAFFTNLLVFGFIGITIGIFIFYFTFKQYLGYKNLKSSLHFGIKKLLFLTLASLPSLVLLSIFFLNINFQSTGNIYSKVELIKWINDARPFIIYNYNGDEIITEQYFHILLILFVLGFVLKRDEDKSSTVTQSNILMVPFIISIVLFFLEPDGSGAGMMSFRYCNLLYIFGLVWVISRAVYSKINSLLIITAIILHFGLLLKHLNTTIKGLDYDAKEIYTTAIMIPDNSIVLPINFSENWLEPHFSNYLGVDKPIVILENYEASIGWFPLKWNIEKMPNIQLAEKNEINGLYWPNNTKSKIKRQIDFVFIYGNQNKIDDSNWSELKCILTNNYKLYYKSKNNYVFLYKKMD